MVPSLPFPVPSVFSREDIGFLGEEGFYLKANYVWSSPLAVDKLDP
jgi:hypothetical protein